MFGQNIHLAGISNQENVPKQALSFPLIFSYTCESKALETASPLLYHSVVFIIIKTPFAPSNTQFSHFVQVVH
jgi:hypothetical protein